MTDDTDGTDFVSFSFTHPDTTRDEFDMMQQRMDRLEYELDILRADHFRLGLAAGGGLGVTLVILALIVAGLL